MIRLPITPERSAPDPEFQQTKLAAEHGMPAIARGKTGKQPLRRGGGFWSTFFRR
jgi:hypothetical protein